MSESDDGGKWVIYDPDDNKERFLDKNGWFSKLDSKTTCPFDSLEQVQAQKVLLGILTRCEIMPYNEALKLQEMEDL